MLRDFLFTIYPTLTLPLQRGGNKISSLPPLQVGIKGGNSNFYQDDGRFFTRTVLSSLVVSGRK
jgi:hypothetical protein